MSNNSTLESQGQRVRKKSVIYTKTGDRGTSMVGMLKRTTIEY